MSFAEGVYILLTEAKSPPERWITLYSFRLESTPIILVTIDMPLPE
jgi:hypothetical protein